MVLAKTELVYNKDEVTLYKMDCVEGMRKYIPNESVDIVVTSPPYNIGIEYNEYEDKKPQHLYLSWIHEVGLELKRVLKKDGSLFLNIGSDLSDPWKPFDIINQFRFDFKLQNTINWIKAISTDKESHGHFRPINSHRFLSQMQEFIFHLTKTGNVELDKDAIGVPYQDKTNIERLTTPKQIRDRGNVWFIPYQTIQSSQTDRPHPASFPPALPEMCIKLHGVEKTKLIIDPFNGIGGTARAAVKFGIPYIGFDVDEEYLDTTIHYVNETQNLMKQLANNERWW